jgi:hypothetical protein
MFRADSQKLKWERSPNGLLKAFITLGTADADLEYYSVDSNGLTKRTEKISIDQLRADESLQTAFGAPVTLSHPKSKRFDGNKEGLMIGSAMQEVAIDGNSVVLASTISDQRADRLIKESQERYDGLMPEISPGYFLGGLRQDGDIFWQEQRQYDHFALLYPGTGRGKQDVVLRLDSQDAIATAFTEPKKFWTFQTDAQETETKNKETTTMGQLIPVGGQILNTDNADDLAKLPAVVAKLTEDKDAALSLASEAEGKVAAVESEKTELTTQLDAEKARADAAEIKLKELENTRVDADDIAADREKVLTMWNLVTPTLRADNADFAPDYKLGVSEIQKLYLKAKNPELNLDEASDGYLQGLWDALKPDANRNDSTTPLDAFGKVIQMQQAEGRVDAGVSRAAKRAERIKAAGMKSIYGAAN